MHLVASVQQVVDPLYHSVCHIYQGVLRAALGALAGPHVADPARGSAAALPLHVPL